MLPVFLLTCPGREAECAATLAAWARTDWGAAPHVFCNEDRSAHIPHRIVAGFRELLRRGLATGAPRFLLLEDDLLFVRDLRAQVEAWPPLAHLHLGLLYDLGLPRLATFPAERHFHADPAHCRGAQARLFSRPFAEHCLQHLTPGYIKQDEQIARLAAPLRPHPRPHPVARAACGKRQRLGRGVSPGDGVCGGESRSYALSNQGLHCRSGLLTLKKVGEDFLE